MAERICPRCTAPKDAAFFYRNASRADGLSTYCKDCTRELRAERYRDTIRAQQAVWRAKNPERAAEHGRRWSKANPEKVRAKAARRRARDLTHARIIARTGDLNKRAKKAGCPGIVTTAAVIARWAVFGGRCWMCGDVATQVDHVKPLTAGGANYPANLRPACKPCNDRKHGTWPWPTEVRRGRAAFAGQGVGGRAA